VGILLKGIDAGQGRKSKKNGRSRERPSLTGRLEESRAKSGKKNNYYVLDFDHNLPWLTFC
jgi:hypothetical protein